MLQELGRRADERDMYRACVIDRSRRRGIPLPAFVEREVACERDPGHAGGSAFLSEEEQRQRKLELEAWLEAVFTDVPDEEGTGVQELQDMAARGLLGVESGTSVRGRGRGVSRERSGSRRGKKRGV